MPRRPLSWTNQIVTCLAILWVAMATVVYLGTIAPYALRQGWFVRPAPPVVARHWETGLTLTPAPQAYHSLARLLHRPDMAPGLNLPGVLAMGGLGPNVGRLYVLPTMFIFVDDTGDASVYHLRTNSGAPALRYLRSERTQSGVETVFGFEDGAEFWTHAGRPLFALTTVRGLRAWIDSAPRPKAIKVGPPEPLGGVESGGSSDSSIVAEAWASPYADTLRGLFGTPTGGMHALSPGSAMATPTSPDAKEGDGLAGLFTAGDSILVLPSNISSPALLDMTLAHEMAHHWQRANRHASWLLRGTMRPVPNPERYGASSALEQQAEAMATALGYLRRTAPDTADLLEHAERTMPGTRAALAFLLGQPTMAHHPWAGRRWFLAIEPVPAASTDVTTVNGHSGDRRVYRGPVLMAPETTHRLWTTLYLMTHPRFHTAA